jgi:hypothetical protein
MTRSFPGGSSPRGPDAISAPGLRDTIVASVLLGPLGAVWASHDAQEARRSGYSAKPYWTAFWTAWLTSWLVISVGFGLVLTGFLSAQQRTTGAAAGSQLQLRPVLAAMLQIPATGTASIVAGAPGTQPRDASDPAWITPAIVADFQAEVCPVADPSTVPDPASPMFACTRDGELLALGPAEVAGPNAIDSAAVEADTYTQGQWFVHVRLRSPDAAKLAQLTEQLQRLAAPRNRMAILQGDSVLSAPSVRAALTTGDVPVAGNFSRAAAEDLVRSIQP